MKTSALDYHLPEELIAQYPCETRDGSRLMVLNRATGHIEIDVFRNITDYLKAGDAIVFNETRVIRARLQGRKSTGGKAEVFLLRETGPGVWEALVKPSARIKPGTSVLISDTLEAVVGEVLEGGRRRVTFDEPNVLEILERLGEIPLPPYIQRNAPERLDESRYQTVYAHAPGAVAAPTAGLHYTEDVLNSLGEAGVTDVRLILHVGYGSFKPIQCEDIEDHQLDGEVFSLSDEVTTQLNTTRTKGGRIVAVGTTSTRVLETQCREGVFSSGEGTTSHYIYPPYKFQAVDVLQTNFHLPRSSLLALVCAFAGTDLVFEAYRRAIEERFRFYSYGDAMLIL